MDITGRFSSSPAARPAWAKHGAHARRPRRQVVIADLQEEAGNKVARELGGAFVGVRRGQEADGQAVVAKAVSMGKLVGLVNCAGIAPAVKTVGKDGVSARALRQVISVNLIGSSPPRGGGDVPQRTRADRRGAALISTASVAAYDGQIGQAAYSASKGRRRRNDLTCRSPATWRATASAT